MNGRDKVVLIGTLLGISLLASCATTSKRVEVFPLDAETPESQSDFAHIKVPGEIKTISIDGEKVDFGSARIKIEPGEHILSLMYYKTSYSVSGNNYISSVTKSGVVPLPYMFLQEKVYRLFSVVDRKGKTVSFHCREEMPEYKSSEKGKVVIAELPREIELSYDPVPVDKEYIVIGSVHLVLNRMTIFDAKPTQEEIIFCLKRKAIEYGADALFDTYFTTEYSFSEPGFGIGKAKVIDAILVKYMNTIE